MTSESVADDVMMPLRVTGRKEIARDIWSFGLAHPDSEPLPGYTPGAHVTVETPSGARRQYSLCGPGIEPDRYQLGIKAERPGRGASLSMIESLHVGDILPVSAPENSFPLARSHDYLFIAGGIGITPILSMLRYLDRTGGADFRLIYCTRDRESTAFAQELESSRFAERVTIHHDGGDPDQVYDLWPEFETPRDLLVYCCGPRPMMEEVGDMSGHWKPGAIRFEDFASDVAAVRPDDRPFTVRHADSGETYKIPADATILETLRARGQHLRSSCESGACGACRAELVAGEADHRDIVLEDRERGSSMMICVSRALTDELVLRW
jgi:phthalate 4,5-dioxygenase reductase subunit